MKKGWTLVPLKEVCLDFIVPQRDKPTAFDGDIPWCRIEDIEGRYLNGSRSGQKVTKELADKMNMHLCPKGTVISACSASIGNQAITTTDCYTNQTFIGLVVNPDLLYNVYLYFFLESQTKSLLSLGQGATIKYISKDKYKSMLIPLPSIGEQQRIVSRLDSAFAHIDELKANAEKQLCEARALFQRALTKAMEPKEGWAEKRIDEVCSIARGGSPRPIKDYITNDPNGLNWIKIGDTDMGGKYIYSTKEKIKPEGLKKSRWVEEDEFLLSNSMSFGRPYILKTNGCIHDGWLVLRDYQKYLDIDFFYYVLSSEFVQKQFRTKAQGSTVSNLNTDRVASVTIPVPSLSEQQRIVSRLDSLSAHVRELEEVTQKTIAECDALKQALLRKVFE
jgi:restriction endonuclease S subunit